MDARADDAGERLTRTARASRSETRTAGEAATAAKTDCSAGTRRRTTTTTRRLALVPKVSGTCIYHSYIIFICSSNNFFISNGPTWLNNSCYST